MERTAKIPTALCALGLAFAVTGCTTPVRTSGLGALHPEARHGYTEIESNRPTMRWESFPRQQDLDADHEGRLKTIEDVGYDLRIYKEEDGRPGRLVYRRKGLAKPEHKLERPLEADTKYFWSVRARFTMDGKRRVTEWGVVLPRLRARHARTKGAWPSNARRSPLIPNRHFYRFETP